MIQVRSAIWIETCKAWKTVTVANDLEFLDIFWLLIYLKDLSTLV